ncbi:otefin [Drosophila bipectinata]|uniref:otefin n=1 Tax=Drosophila bipectinata TaxID=42026 RepID=UPI001C89087F|nr:otefin [Drosophila bipectinata]
MAEVDDLDTLSNAELRTKMLAQGLPNIPVTDSSRKILVKRLRASLGGQASPAAGTASPKKSSSRRETLAASSAAPSAASTPVDKLDGSKVAPATKARRTIAATEAKEAKEVVTKKAAPPIQTRRSSTTSTGSEKREPERVVKKPETIVEEPVTYKRTSQRENTLEVNSLIVLESDDEEDEQLARAAELVEKKIAHKEKSKQSSVNTTYEKVSKVDPPRRPAYESAVDPPRRPAYEPPVEPRRPVYEPPVEPRRPAYEPSGVPRRPAYEPLVEPRRPTYESRDLPRRPTYETSAAPVLSAAPSGLSARPQTSSSTSYDYLGSHTGRYSSYVRTSAQSYVTAEAPTTRTYANELSDDNDAVDDAEYESTFAQNLARLKAERIGDRSSPYTRRTVGSAYGSLARRSLRQDNQSVRAAFNRWWASVDQKYKIRQILFIIFVIFLLVAVYSFFY